MSKRLQNKATQRVTNEKPIPPIPLSFEQTIAAALETKPERKKPLQKKAKAPKA